MSVCAIPPFRIVLIFLPFLHFLQPLPEFSRIPGLVLPSQAFSDCLAIVEFLHNYGKVLGFDVAREIPSLSTLQEGLFNVGDSLGEVLDLLVKLVKVALYDPGLPSCCQVRLCISVVRMPPTLKQSKFFTQKNEIILNNFLTLHNAAKLTLFIT